MQSNRLMAFFVAHHAKPQGNPEWVRYRINEYNAAKDASKTAQQKACLAKHGPLETDGDVCPICGSVLQPDMDTVECGGCGAIYYPSKYVFSGNFR